MTRLSVNLNKVALLRNSRRTGVPDVLHFARIALDNGARGLTLHPRPDERHIRGSDVPALAELMKPVRPAVEFNIEGYPDERLMDILSATLPEQCTLVPDAPEAFTSEEGWKLDSARWHWPSHISPRLRRWAVGSCCSPTPTQRSSRARSRPGRTGSKSTPGPTPQIGRAHV